MALVIDIIADDDLVTSMAKSIYLLRPSKTRLILRYLTEVTGCHIHRGYKYTHSETTWKIGAPNSREYTHI